MYPQQPQLIPTDKHRDNLSQRFRDTIIDTNDQLNISSLPSCQTAATYFTNNHNIPHKPSQQQQHRNMATLSPSKAHTSLGRSPISVDQERFSPHRAALIPRCALPEPDMPQSSHSTSYSASSAAVQGLQSLSSDVAYDGAMSLPSEVHYQSEYTRRLALRQLSC